MNQKQLSDLLNPYNDLALEYDWLTRVLSYTLTEQGVNHSCYYGGVSYYNGVEFDQEIMSHYWILTESGFLVDYRLKMWLTEIPDHPLPVDPFRVENFPYLKYTDWIKIDMSISPAIFDALTVNPLEFSQTKPIELKPMDCVDVGANSDEITTDQKEAMRKYLGKGT